MLNDVFREAERLGVTVLGVRVTAYGGFDTGASQSRGISYAVEVDSAESPSEIAALLEVVDAVAELPKALRTGTSVQRIAR